PLRRHVAIPTPDVGIMSRLGLRLALLGAGAELFRVHHADPTRWTRPRLRSSAARSPLWLPPISGMPTMASLPPPNVTIARARAYALILKVFSSMHARIATTRREAGGSTRQCVQGGPAGDRYSFGLSSA